MSSFTHGFVPYNISYEERAIAKKAGMFWNADLQVWMGKPGLPYSLVRPIFFLLSQKWPYGLPGEDRSLKKIVLLPDPLPTTLHEKNFRTTLGCGEWKLVRNYVISRAKGFCEICDSPLGNECHEIFSFDFPKKTARIIRLQALCHECHSSIHWAFTNLTEPEDVVENLYIRMKLMNDNHGKDIKMEFKKMEEDYRKKEKVNWEFDSSFFDVKI